MFTTATNTSFPESSPEALLVIPEKRSKISFDNPGFAGSKSGFIPEEKVYLARERLLLSS